MTLPELLADEPARRAAFPVVAEKAYFAHAGICALPRRVSEMVMHYAVSGAAADQESAMPAQLLGRTRSLAAAAIGARADEIALIGPTSLALSLVAAGLPVRRRENILVYQDDYPSNVYPWMALAERGVEVRFLNVREPGRIRPADVLGQVDEQTRLVALSSCHYLSGWRIDHEAIGRGLRERGILFCLDAIQTVGVVPTRVDHVDILAAGAHKWLLGPCGAGILYVRKEVQEHLAPAVFGWHNVLCPQFVAQDDLVFKQDARRYEAGTANVLGVVGLAAALELLQELGAEAIAQAVAAHRAFLVPALQARGFQVLHAAAPAESTAGITTCWKEGADLPALYARLLEAGIVTSLRSDRGGRRYLRFSPHCFNTTAELQRAVELL